METSYQRCLRMAVALEDLVAQEAAALESRDYTEVSILQDRAAPLVDFLAQNASTHCGDIALRNRIAAVQQLRARSSALLASEMARTRAELHESQHAQRQVAKVAPAYARSASIRAKLCAVG